MVMKKFTVNTQGLLLLLLLVVGLFVLCISQEDISIPPAPMEEQEQEALYNAIQGFVGNQWNGSDLYPDPCGWTPIQGVSCDLSNGFWYVTVMNIGPLYDNSLPCTENARFTNHLFRLKHLRTLSFFNCFISPEQNPTKIPTSSWENLTNSLESLEFRSNPGLIGKIPSTIGCLKELQSLVLIENGVTGKLPMEIGKLVKLKRLVLAGNKFVGQVPASFGDLTGLLIFDSSRNNLSGSLPVTVGGLTSLLKLDLSNNMLEGILPEEIGNLKNVTLLDLRSNKFSGGLIQELQEMFALRELVLSNNLIGGDLMNVQWQNLQNLEILDLSNTGLIGSLPDSIEELKRLRFLGLNNNNLSGRVSPGLAALPCIGAIYINGNNFTGALEFSDRFYKKMGRRFGAWNNPNLCYSAALTSTKHAPYGVKYCLQESAASLAIAELNVTFREGSLNHRANSGFSLGNSSSGIDCLWWKLVVEKMAIVVFVWSLLLW